MHHCTIVLLNTVRLRKPRFASALRLTVPQVPPESKARNYVLIHKCMNLKKIRCAFEQVKLCVRRAGLRRPTYLRPLFVYIL